MNPLENCFWIKIQADVLANKDYLISEYPNVNNVITVASLAKIMKWIVWNANQAQIESSLEMTANVLRVFMMMAYIQIASLAIYHAKHVAVVILIRVPVAQMQIY